MAEPCNQEPKLSVYAYGIQPIYGGPQGRHYQWRDDGGIILWEPYAYHHYWIDENLQYGERTRDTSAMPQCLLVTSTTFEVELRGPRDYIIKSKNA